MKTGVLVTAGLLGVVFTLAANPIPAGSKVQVQTDETIDVRSAGDGRVYRGSVGADVFDTEGHVTIPRGAPAELIVRRTGPKEIAVDLDSVEVNGRRYSVDASTEEQMRRKEGIGENKRTGEYVGGGALLGTVLGAIAGGGKGAAIGALAGGAAGAGTQVLTRGEHIRVPAETVLTYRLDQTLDVRPDPGFERDGHHFHPYENRGDHPPAH